MDRTTIIFKHLSLYGKVKDEHYNNLLNSENQGH